MLGKSSNDTQENSKDALKKEEELKKVQEVQEENAKLNRDKTNLAREKDKLADQNKTLIETNQNLAAEKTELNNKITGLSTDKENLTKDKAELQKRVKELEQSQQVLENVKTDLTNENTKLKNEKTELTSKITGLSTDKENLTTTLSNAKTQAEQTSQKLNELERRHAPYQKLERLYEVFLEVKDRLNFNFVATTHSAMDLIASVLSDSKYYLESLYNRASQELSDKRSDKGEKLAELFDLLFEYIKDSKFERLKEPSAYDYSCKTLYPEQNSSQKIQRVVLRGYTYDKKIACYTIVDMGS
ncbi:hypothetical protein D2C75_06795 [Helicobacter pylori]|uniref:hypothetical protein n=1 Tax=Helicobacter pylori TaxID=210 RepID=UPI0009A3F85C|nr:hypothetical protein [Helicobacter pylori]NHA48494.1 hypothetical protein [Helicobacter pylori]NHA74024.1 hypothetical protein [Helicobacter pylori]QEF40156.1 hypothetical protein D2C75_06795 [Helicobacter pylori]WRE60261.1 hypothetical protein KVE24_00275 [Helicobacter pylori]